MRMPNTKAVATATAMVKKLRDAGHEAFFVGGAVRDMLLGKMPQDIDIATAAVPETIATLFPHHHPIGEKFGIILAVENELTFEVATFREESDYRDGRHPGQINYTSSPAADAARRDFTINGMFYDPISDTLFDWFGGQEDLRRGIIRTIGAPEARFSEDYLRMLRAVRFASRFGFVIATDTAAAIHRLGSNVAKLSAERIREELNAMLLGNAPEKAFRSLRECGLLEIVLPEVAVLAGVEQPPEFHPEGDVFEHTMLMLRHMAWPSLELAWSALLHDAGKPETRTLGANGVAHFYCHENESAAIAENCLERLKFSREQINSVVSAVANHMRFAMVPQMRTGKIRRLLAEPNFAMQLELHRLDCIACHRKFDSYLLLLDKLEENDGETALPPPLISGKDLLQLGMMPGPAMGRIINEISELQLEGIITTAAEALEHARNHVENNSSTLPKAPNSGIL